MERVIEARGLTRTFASQGRSRTALEGFDLDVAPGEFLAVVGPSGSGKSTLLGILGGLDSGYRGTLALFGRDPQRMTDRELSRLRGEHIGFVFQAFFLLDQQSVLDNVMVPSLFVSRHDAREAAISALREVGLEERARDRASDLSGGQRQRVAIARAIAHRPQLLLCDEPTGNLDPGTTQRVIEVFRALHERGTAIVCSTHEARLEQAATRRVYLEEGRSVKRGDEEAQA